jgi:hypothetical protein
MLSVLGRLPRNYPYAHEGDVCSDSLEKREKFRTPHVICPRVFSHLRLPHPDFVPLTIPSSSTASPIFKDLWQEQTSAMFTGDGGTGKTHFGGQMAYAIASGTEIPGTPFLCPQPRDFVFFTQEDEQEHIRTMLLTQHPSLKDEPDVARRIRIVSTAIQGETLLFTKSQNRKYIESNIPEYGVAAFECTGHVYCGRRNF